MSTRPAPRAVRGAKVSAISRAPVAPAMAPADSSPPPCKQAPRIRIAARRPDLSAAATRSTAAPETRAGVGLSRGGADPSAAFQAVSAGRIRVAIWPGGDSDAATALAPSAATVSALVELCTQPDTGRAKPAMSLASGASYCAW